jgi:outer membrane protein OmpA-like peptidoglycan-associated protein
MSLRARLAVLAAALTLGATVAAADPTGHYLYVSPVAGFTVFDGRYKFPSQSLKDTYYAGGRLGYQGRSWLALELAGGWSPSHENAPAGADVKFWHASGNLVVSPFRGVRGNPFLTIGLGTSRLTSDDATALLNGGLGEPGRVKQGNLELGGGLNFWVTEATALRLEARDAGWLGKKHIGTIGAHTVMTTFGLTHAFGSKPRDTDGDGVPDRRDACPATPKGATVDRKGCPGDTDGDGVLDGLDRCPTTPTGCVVDATGCSKDADGDGVCDGLDQCPGTPQGATVDSKGCTSDSDGDGVLDGLDQCPDTPKGCAIDEKGCSKDADGDGVCDGLDQCPGTTPGVPVDANGCPAGFQERETELLDTGTIRLQNVQFETGRANLKPESLPTLDAVGDLLVKWPEFKIEIGGHTDSKGSAKLNEKLSYARADSVRAYLLRRFPALNPEQYLGRGYGPSVPVASNDTEEGRALNRRVEFKVLNTGVIMKELERRKQKAAPADTTTTPSPPNK